MTNHFYTGIVYAQDRDQPALYYVVERVIMSCQCSYHCSFSAITLSHREY